MFLQVLLGLLSAGEQLDALLDQYAPPRAPKATATPADPGLLFALGLLALRQRLDLYARSAGAATIDRSPQPTRRSRPKRPRTPRSLLV